MATPTAAARASTANEPPGQSLDRDERGEQRDRQR